MNMACSELVSWSDRSQWLNGRATSIGSSDAATLLGQGYAGASRYSLWADKCLGVKPEFEKAVLKRLEKGKLAEPYIAGLCRMEFGWDVQFDPGYSYRRNIENPYLTASLDAWVVEDEEPAVLEFKNVSAWDLKQEWNVSSGKAPLKYAIQVQHQLLVTGWQKGYLIALCGFDLYRVPVVRHEGLLSQMRLEYAEFWKHVVDKIPPEIDGSDATQNAVNRVYRSVDAGAVKHLTDEESATIDLYVELQESIEDDAAQLAKWHNQLIVMAGSAEYLLTSDGNWYSLKSSRGGNRKLKAEKRVRVK